MKSPASRQLVSRQATGRDSKFKKGVKNPLLRWREGVQGIFHSGSDTIPVVRSSTFTGTGVGEGEGGSGSKRRWFRRHSTSANSTSASGRSRFSTNQNWPKSNWPRSN